MTRLKDIAELLGMSVTTVSRALNGFPEVSEKTRALVRATAEQHDYHPNPIAKKLVSGRSGMIGLITRRPHNSLVDDGFMDFAMGMSAWLTEHDLDLVLRVGLEDDEVEPYRRMVAKKSLDAFVLNAPVVDDPRIAFLRAKDVPFVVHGKVEAQPDYPYYDLDNYKAARDGTEYLIAQGHRRIALLNGPEKMAFAIERLRGFRDACRARGCPVDEALIHHGPQIESFGHASALAVISGDLGPPPTAIQCSNTFIAEGAMRALIERQIAVPDKMSLLAHDDGMPQALRFPWPKPLTVTRLAFRDACRPLAELVVGRLTKAPLERLQVNASAELIVGGTTAKVTEGIRHG